jgi:hypothetical protein
MLSPPALPAYFHPVFPWEEVDGSINYVHLVGTLVVLALLVVGFIFLVVKLFRRLR